MKLSSAVFGVVAALAAVVVEVQSEAVVLSAENFDEHVKDSGKHSFVKFYAPWCGHCKRMKPDWDRLGALYHNHEKVVIGTYIYYTLYYIPCNKQSLYARVHTNNM